MDDFQGQAHGFPLVFHEREEQSVGVIQFGPVVVPLGKLLDVRTAEIPLFDQAFDLLELFFHF
ncbi:hypothetical protein [Deinococcus roseus]|uniref:hypothetical protein n=1 Tax=Deinococcus roseus TaxID=392414 RepID=UPI003570AE52